MTGPAEAVAGAVVVRMRRPARWGCRGAAAGLAALAAGVWLAPSPAAGGGWEATSVQGVIALTRLGLAGVLVIWALRLWLATARRATFLAEAVVVGAPGRRSYPWTAVRGIGWTPARLAIRTPARVELLWCPEPPPESGWLAERMRAFDGAPPSPRWPLVWTGLAAAALVAVALLLARLAAA